jgi:hypothetical protein
MGGDGSKLLRIPPAPPELGAWITRDGRRGERAKTQSAPRFPLPRLPDACIPWLWWKEVARRGTRPSSTDHGTDPSIRWTTRRHPLSSLPDGRIRCPRRRFQPTIVVQFYYRFCCCQSASPAAVTRWMLPADCALGSNFSSNQSTFARARCGCILCR